MRTTAHRVAAVAVALVLACGRAPATEDVRETLVSWSASVQEAGHAWLADVVPSRYFIDLVDAARNALDAEATTLEHEPDAPAIDSLRTVTSELRHVVDSLGGAARAGNRIVVRGRLESLARLGGRLRTLHPNAPPQ